MNFVLFCAFDSAWLFSCCCVPPTCDPASVLSPASAAETCERAAVHYGVFTISVSKLHSNGDVRSTKKATPDIVQLARVDDVHHRHLVRDISLTASNDLRQPCTSLKQGTPSCGRQRAFSRCAICSVAGGIRATRRSCAGPASGLLASLWLCRTAPGQCHYRRCAPTK